MSSTFDATAMGQALAGAIGSAQAQANNNELVGHALSLLAPQQNQGYQGRQQQQRNQGTVAQTVKKLGQKTF